MSRLYGKGQRTFQERFGTQKLADRIEDIAVRDEFDDESSAFIESRDFFFLVQLMKIIDQPYPTRVEILV